MKIKIFLTPPKSGLADIDFIDDNNKHASKTPFQAKNFMNTQKSDFFAVTRIFFSFLSKCDRFIHSFSSPFLNEHSTVHSLNFHYPFAIEYFQTRNISLETLQKNKNTKLKSFCEHMQLPPPQILFAEIQFHGLKKNIEFLSPQKAHLLLSENKAVEILDVRESWERSLADLSGSKPLDEPLLKELSQRKDRTSSLLLFCHFGVRSTDFAIRFKSWGYKNVYVLQGGIDAWAQEIDPEMKRYEGGWC